MFTEAYLEPSQTSAMELFSLPLNHILKTYLIRSNCLQVPFFYITRFFLKKLTTVKTLGESPLLTIEQLFSKFEITQWKGVINKEGFLIQPMLKVLKLLHCFLFSLFQILWSKHLQKVKDEKRCCFRRAICLTP